MSTTMPSRRTRGRKSLASRCFFFVLVDSVRRRGRRPLRQRFESRPRPSSTPKAAFVAATFSASKKIPKGANLSSLPIGDSFLVVSRPRRIKRRRRRRKHMRAVVCRAEDTFFLSRAFLLVKNARRVYFCVVNNNGGNFVVSSEQNV